MPARDLPDRPNLSQYKKQAKELVKACMAGDADALQRVRELHPRAPAKVTLADAQFVIAREHGDESWPKFAARVEAAAANRRLPQYGDRRSAPLSQETWQRSSA